MQKKTHNASYYKETFRHTPYHLYSFLKSEKSFTSETLFSVQHREHASPLLVRGVLSAKGPNSSFAKAHRVLLSEPTHIEGEDEDQENEWEDERDCEECKMESRREVRTHNHSMRMKHG